MTWCGTLRSKPIALITQNTKCLADLTVLAFLVMHAKARKIPGESVIDETIRLANEFTGEKIAGPMRMTALSGGQTRSLLIADAITISSAPIILLDEVESGGIFKEKVIESLKSKGKAVLFVTHDPHPRPSCGPADCDEERGSRQGH